MTINKIAIIGECMVELSKTSSTLQHGFGGDTLNTAIYLSRLTPSSKIKVSYLTGLGKDAFSREMLENWEAEDINTEMVHISDSKLPGIYAIETSSDGERSFYYWRNDSAAKYWLREISNQQLAEKLSGYQLIYISGISLAILPEDCRKILLNILDTCHNKRVTIAFDNNFRPALWQDISEARDWYKKILGITDIAFLTFDDEQALWGDKSEDMAIGRTKDLGVKEIVVKRGGEDCIVVSGDETWSIPPTSVNKIVDTTAAGDSFSAGYLAKRIQGGSCEESAMSGHRLAGTVIQHRGAIIPNDVMPRGE